MLLSIIVPVHNEPQEFIETTIKSIQDTIDVSSFEIIAVDDCSRTPLEPIEGVQIIRHSENLGVGQAFRTGIAQAKSENLYLIGSDIRHIKNKWASLLLKELDEHPKAISCATCVGLNKDNMDLNVRQKVSRRNAAEILIFHDHASHPKKPSNFRNILEAKWLKIHKGSMDSFEVPCVLGAAYIVKKEMMEYTDAWFLHRSWGTLEPSISLVFWLLGGSCRTVPSVNIGHVFKAVGTHATPNHHLIYNKMLLSALLFEDYDRDRLINFLGVNPQVKAGWEMYSSRLPEIEEKRREYKEKMVMTPSEYCKLWNIDFRDGDI